MIYGAAKLFTGNFPGARACKQSCQRKIINKIVNNANFYQKYSPFISK